MFVVCSFLPQSFPRKPYATYHLRGDKGHLLLMLLVGAALAPEMSHCQHFLLDTRLPIQVADNLLTL